MWGKIADTMAAQQIELIIHQLDSISILPCVVARFLYQLLQTELLTPESDDIIKSDPVLTARVISIARQRGLSFGDGHFSVSQALDKLPAYVVRDAVLSVKVYQGSDRDDNRISFRKQLVRHAIAVACCAKEITEAMLPQMDSDLAYCAGLLHNIGNLALDDAMPKSFARMVEEAKSQGASIGAIEQKHLGVDYTILGKRLAQKWRLPEQITLAIWLHQSDAAIVENVPEAGIAQVVRLAYTIARQCGIGESGSYDSVDLPVAIIQSLSINIEQLEQIRRNLAEQVGRISKVLGLDSPKAQARYNNVVGATAAQLAGEHTKLLVENRRLQTVSRHLDFIKDFLLSINPADGTIGVAENFAVRWQKFYQTGPVCLYLVTGAGSEFLEAVVVESVSQSKIVCLNTPADAMPIPPALAEGFAVLNADEGHLHWLFEQLDAEFESSRTKLVPLLSGGKAIGAIVFELRCPVEPEQFEEELKAVTSIAGAVLSTVFACANQQHFAEKFALSFTRPKDAQRQIETDGSPRPSPRPCEGRDSLSALAEMAAGAAHELNNPLSVISGGAQILAEKETDPEKKHKLEQIQENAGELSGIIEGLMGFARPKEPRPGRTDVKQILGEAIQLTAQKQNAEQLDVQVDIAEGVKDIFADSAQIALAITNVLCNAVESYTNQLGPIKVTADLNESGNFVKLAISDLGCGMDAETVQKATQPFFSNQPAGRKRGMGLAYTHRLIQLNGGTLKITSQPGSGTTVTIFLPVYS